jgi:hypothetical protein
LRDLLYRILVIYVINKFTDVASIGGKVVIESFACLVACQFEF